ncbi:MAG: hypothetical protein K2L02_01405, partial [Clostridia bacterium]|nr:hypothetical protein [Clostridia bacterium]
DISLTAKWTRVILTLLSIKVTPPANPFTVTALTPIADLGLTVEAVYSSSVSDKPVNKTIPLKVGGGDGYTVNVSSIHVSTTQIVVKYGGFTETLPITVNPINLDEYSDQIDFPNCTKDYTGEQLEIDPLRVTLLPASIRSHVSKIEITYQKGGLDIDKSNVKEQGEYTAIATFTTDPDYELSPISASFVISPPRLAVTVAWNSGTYSYTGSAQHPTAILTDEDGVQLNASQFKYVIFNSSNAPSDGKDADTYTIRVALDPETEKSYKLVGTTSTSFTIDKAKVNKPVPNITSFEYNGEEKTFLLEGLESYMTLAEQGSKGTDAGPYTATVTLDKNHEWTDGGSVATYNWTIEKAKIARPTFGSVSFEYNGAEQSVSGELYGFDESKMVITGDKGKDAKTYTASITPNANYTWDNATTPVTVEWTITKKLISIVWEDEDTFEKKGTTKYNPKIVDFIGLCEGDSFDPVANASSVRYSGDTNKSAVGAYIVKFAALNTSWASNYEIEEDLGKGYRIIAEGADPDDPNNPQVPDPANPNGNNNKGGTTGENPSDGTFISYLPIILSGISLVLIVVFTVMTLNYNSAAKNAMAKTKQLAQISYSFAPVGLLALALGLSETNWWIIAGVLMGLALIMGIVAFTFRRKKQKALQMLAEEEKRVAEEKELAKEEKAREEQQRREEEQRRRDDELKMMFAAMQQNYGQPQPQQMIDYDMLQNMIASSVQSLLPGLQQLQALPPASFDVNASLSEETQKEIDGLHEQIAQQQEMLAQILQNQQSYMTYEEEVVEDLSWLGESDEMISLEESYGALSDEGRRFYYEIGSYIMNKPRTSQNDGRYAVLFKYRGRTIFKLAIKDDAPVLYYPAGGGRSEIRVADTSSLELAKSVIDRQTVKVDNELN